METTGAYGKSKHEGRIHCVQKDHINFGVDIVIEGGIHVYPFIINFSYNGIFGAEPR